MPETEHARPPDPLSDVLSTLELRGDVFARTEASSPWGIAFPCGESRFHLVERGEVWVEVEGLKRPIKAVAGDVLVLVHGHAHTLSDGRGQRPAELVDLIKQRRGDGQRVLRVGRGKPETHLSCGRFHLEAAGRHALLAALPPLLKVEGAEGRPRETLALILRLFVAETHDDSPGSMLASSRIVDLILIHAIRAWIAQQGAGVGGWLGAMREPQVAAALVRLHAAPERAWTVSELAAAAGLSRSPFAARFRALVGEPPLKYLTRWRMHRAAQLLRQGVSVAEAAERVGYDSEAAFSRTFKRYMGTVPVKLRVSKSPRPTAFSHTASRPAKAR
jgi:AraC-like DNA-binding protein